MIKAQLGFNSLPERELSLTSLYIKVFPLLCRNIVSYYLIIQILHKHCPYLIGPIECLQDFISPETDIKVMHSFLSFFTREVALKKRYPYVEIPQRNLSAITRVSLCTNHPITVYQQYINNVYFHRANWMWEILKQLRVEDILLYWHLSQCIFTF